ncbi:hypothetical protein M8C21_016486 [Ambrosia artemisiifolia]|uniref:Uncharacterized protein n=1 Tax=Ambrosia artemisiifolia TaxID=4212 RepID=A0AAD5DH52_AMBAR|nr:hypothetical protein M8C21_016486 [Ambrosia artemisiifolia]
MAVKGRKGLLKKARHLSILCDVDVAVIVFNACGKLYQSSSGSTNSVECILSRYQKTRLKEVENTTNKADEDLRKTFQTCKELLQTVDRLAEMDNAEELSVNDMTQLEQELNAALMQARLRKAHLMMTYVSTLKEKTVILRNLLYVKAKECLAKLALLGAVALAAFVKYTRQKENRLSEENEELKKQVASAKENEYGDGGGLNDLATNQMNSPQLITLPLFIA